MTADEGLRLLRRLAEERGADWFEGMEIAVVARAGSDAPHVVRGLVARLSSMDHGPPLHCLVVPGKMQVVEEEAWHSLVVA